MKKFNFLENLLRRKFAMSGMRVDAVNSDSLPTVNRQSRLTSQQRHNSVSGAKVAREWLNGSTHLRVWPLKIVAVLAILLTIGIGNAWADSKSFNKDDFSSSTSSTRTPITVTFSAKSISGQQIRFSSGATVTFTSSSGNITGIAVSTNSTNQYIKDMGATVSTGTWSGSGTSYSWSGNASSITMTAGAACRITTMTVTYSAASCTQNPTVSAGDNSSVTATTATVSCSSGISSLGSAGCSISSYGFVLNTTGTPTISDTKHQVGTTYTTTGTSFSMDLTELSAETTYYVRPYATNGNGTAYGTQTSFTTPALPKYTISFETGTGNPSQADITETVAGAGITLPAGPTPACSGNGWSFAGWGYKSCDETSDEPYLYFPGNTYYPIDDETLYAVYVQGETSTTTYKLLSEGAQVAPDANYIITATAVDKAIKSEVYSSYYIEAADVTVTEDENGYYIANPNSELIWNMGKTGSTISLYNASDNNYLKIYETSGHHNLALDASKYTFTLSEVRDPGYASTFKMESTNDPGHYILYSTDNDDFTATSNNNLDDTELYLYKQMNSGTYNSNPVCCDKEVTLAHNSPSNGTVSFAPAGPIETCDGTVNTTMTITPAAGYKLSAFNYSTGTGTISPTNQSPGAPNTSLNSATPQEITLTFGQGVEGTCTANATFSEMVVTSWAWTLHVGGAAVTTDPVQVYVGQKVQCDVAYTPNDVLNTHKNNTSYSYPAPWSNSYLGSPGKAGDHFTVTGTNSTGEGTTSVTLTHNDGPTKTINYKVIALPKVTFVDRIHDLTDFNAGGEDLPSSGILEATISADKFTVTTTLKTPTHADVDDPGDSYNTCERQHLHLIGWIDKAWADENPDATHSEIVAATAYFYAPNADIDLVAKNGKEYIAVWAKEVTP